jgi:general L-amino acid transport system permease protein
MSTESLAFVRHAFVPAEDPPVNESTWLHWLKKNLFASPTDAAMTIIAGAIVLWYVPAMINWLFVQAVWTGSDRTACATLVQGGIQPDGWSGACWAFVGDKFQLFMFGRYTAAERWRPILVVALFVALLTPLLIPRIGYKGLNAVALFFGLPIVAYFLLLGGAFGLPYVETPLWGGLMVTLVISFVGIAVSLPLGILLALGRRSNMPIVKGLCIGFIELIRGVPLITVLFMASVLLPLFLEPGDNIDKFVRALVGVSIFASAYMAEVVRGGLQAIPKGQFEAADALGLNYFQRTYLIILPQAIKLVIPGIVNTFIGMFKDTSLVSIISMYDLLGIVRQSFADATWATPVTPMTGLIFAGFVFWLFCFGMSRYSAYVERRLDTSHKR